MSEWVGVGVGVCTTVTFEYFKSLPFSNKSQNPTYKVGGDLQCYLSLTTSLKRNCPEMTSRVNSRTAICIQIL